MERDSVRTVVQAARRAAREADAPLLLAVSGGLDSMVLLHGMAAGARERVAAVATFDHGSGAYASDAAAHVAREAGWLGFPVVMGRSRGGAAGGGQEAAWRRERHEFLRAVAAPLGARVVTAHTEDDHLETILMRILRGSGARGLAALAAPGLALRPFVGLRRAVLEEYARGHGEVRWREDPSNAERVFLRNRIRHDLLPALRLADPTIDAALLDLARRAAEWRAEVDHWVERSLRPARGPDGSLRVGAAELTGFDRDSLAMAWGALAARIGLALDRRGTLRAAAFISRDPRAGRVPLSGGWWLVAAGGDYHLRRSDGTWPSAARALGAAAAVEWGTFRFRPATPEECARVDRERGDVWTAELPTEREALVRAWRPGDRLLPSAGQPRRRVKRYLSEGGVRGPDRTGWPVVVSGEDVVWIPGVRRSDAATVRSGRPVRHFLCERTTC
jgi:tRNA(Ile)-lysidine synthase